MGIPNRLVGRLYPAFSGLHVRAGGRQSMPSRSIAISAGASATLPSVAAGQTKRPLSSLFENRHDPCPSNQITLMRCNRPVPTACRVLI